VDLLDRYGAPTTAGIEDLGNGLGILPGVHPSRRDQRVLDSKAYDAREIYLTDKSKRDPQSWRLASLLQGLN